ncbi:MAG: hypothetical protein ACRC33_30405 [Gemmataceae bacterium]
MGGQPLSKGTITFHPDKGKGNAMPNPAVGNVENGQYTVSSAVKGGTPAGWYKVTIQASVPINPKDEYSEHRSIINEKYGDVEKSGLTAEVKEGTPSYDFTVTK